MTPQLRAQVERAIEVLVDLLDAVDGDENLEGGGDIEPDLGWSVTGACAGNDDRELQDYAN